MTDTIAVHRKHILTPYVRAADAQRKVDSARQLVIMAISGHGMLHSHRRHLLKLAQWWVTEADGKWRTRFRSQAVVHLAMTEPEAQVRINHEHVYGRASLADRMLADPTQVEPILELCVGCIVTVDEHRRLSALRDAEGWERYERAGVFVVDAESSSNPAEWHLFRGHVTNTSTPDVRNHSNSLL